jgi:hypothetical protein
MKRPAKFLSFEFSAPFCAAVKATRVAGGRSADLDRRDPAR